MADPQLSRNRLDEEASPYLRQHADNPVHWQPWDDAALAAAESLDRPIFLSVGYSACHWCHVMEQESFQDEGVAEVLNDRYVPIKVDREERPDVDSIYQTICQLVTRGGGWPLSVWLTPDGRPFYVGTYFPREERRGMPGFLDLLTGLADTWEHDRSEVEQRADEWLDAIEGQVDSVAEPGELGDNPLRPAADAALRAADRQHGGFGTGGPKFPQPARIELLLRAGHRYGTNDHLTVAIEALRAMANGGMYDQLGGGFHRYATDRDWTVPHFEKMLYDNATLPRVYLAAHQLTGEPRFATVAKETLEFVERELTHPGGGFFSTLDAQSERDGEREEGAYYVWTPAEIRDVLDDVELANLVCDRFGITESGNFEGRTVLTIAEDIETLADTHGQPDDAIVRRLERARATLRSAREMRPRPARDEKVLSGWNGLMISAFAEAGLVLESAFLDRAANALDFVRDELWNGSRLRRRFKDGDVQIDGYLDDYAFLARGAVDTYQLSGDLDHLSFALTLGRVIVDEFVDPETGALYYTPTSGERLVARPQELTDQSTPSSAGVAIDTLLTLSHFTRDDDFDGAAEAALELYSDRINANPLQHTSLALAADRLTEGSAELTVIGDGLPPDWRAALAETYIPNRLLTIRPPDLQDWLGRLNLDRAPPIWHERQQVDAKPTVFACRSFTCSRPYTDIRPALDWFDSEAMSD